MNPSEGEHLEGVDPGRSTTNAGRLARFRRERALPWLRRYGWTLPLVLAIAAVCVVVAAGVYTKGWFEEDPELRAWKNWLDVAQKAATVVGIVFAAYLAFRRFLAGGGELEARCTLEISGALHEYGGDAPYLTFDLTLGNEGSSDLCLLEDELEMPRVEVRCLTITDVESARERAVFDWASYTTLQLPVFDDHEDIEPGVSIRDAVALALPAEEQGDPYELFRAIVWVHARSADDGDGSLWSAAAIVSRSENVSEVGHGNR